MTNPSSLLPESTVYRVEIQRSFFISFHRIGCKISMILRLCNCAIVTLVIVRLCNFYHVDCAMCNCYHVDFGIVQLLPCWLCDCNWKLQNLHIDCAIVQKFAFWLCDCVKICILIVRLCENMQFNCGIVGLCLIVLIVCDCVVYPEPNNHLKYNTRNMVL